MASKTRTPNMGITAANGAKVDPNMVQNILLSEIDIDWTPRPMGLGNSRFPVRDGSNKEYPDWITGVAGNADYGEVSFSGIKTSIHELALVRSETTKKYQPSDGQRDPVTVRPHPDKKSKKRYALVTGFQRATSVEQLMEEHGVKGATVRAFVKVMSDQDAILENLRENTARSEVGEADICEGISRYREFEPEVTSVKLSGILGKSQNYIAKLMGILDGAKGDVLDQWREANKRLGVDKMRAIAKLGTEKEQKEAFEKAQSASSGSTGRGGSDRWVDTAIAMADNAGRALGYAARARALNIMNPKTFFAEHLRTFVKFRDTPARGGEDATQKQRFDAQVAEVEAAFKSGYQKGVKGDPLPDGSRPAHSNVDTN
jgi:ParB-like chromosome segregation protein Spo0J